MLTLTKNRIIDFEFYLIVEKIYYYHNNIPLRVLSNGEF